ncbi:recombinase family protein [Aeromicrobium sp. CF4.19]|uniref:recombinase family protein n=1 Tax=Aeromicrobium sp. CF4.19 TaxID=3373082 RepID=UPI003EE6A0D8
MTLIGYARVSTLEQDEALQVDALTAAGCDLSRIYVDHITGASTTRPELDRAWDYLRPGDTLVVWRLDRLGRSLKHLVQLVGELGQREVEFRSLMESIDTTTPTGRLTFHLFASIAEFERDLIRERTAAGLAAAKARGRVGGRPKALSATQVEQARRMMSEDNLSATDVAAVLRVSRATLYRAIQGET